MTNTAGALMPTPDETRETIERDFTAMERDLATAQPGVMDVLAVYGQYEAALRQAELYLAALTPKPIFWTSNRSRW